MDLFHVFPGEGAAWPLGAYSVRNTVYPRRRPFRTRAPGGRNVSWLPRWLGSERGAASLTRPIRGVTLIVGGGGPPKTAGVRLASPAVSKGLETSAPDVTFLMPTPYIDPLGELGALSRSCF